MLPEIIAGSLAVNKIVDQGAENKRLGGKYNELLHLYEELASNYEILVKHNEELLKALEREKVVSGSSAESAHKRNGSLIEQLLESNLKIKDLQESVDNQNKEFDRLNGLDRYRRAENIMLVRILEEIPEEMRWAAFAKVFAEHPEENIAQEFRIDKPEQVAEVLTTSYCFVNGISDPEKFEEIKKKALMMVEQSNNAQHDTQEEADESEDYGMMM